MKDYYSILGVDKTATDGDIKTAYRRLAMKYHPDRNQGDKDSEEKFKEINEAYENLSNPDLKNNYDSQFMGNNEFAHGSRRTWTFTENNMGDFFEIFGHVFKDGNPGARFNQKRNHKVVTLTLEEAYVGKKVTIHNEVTFNIPAGVRSESRVFLNNTMYVINVLPHHKFKRSNDDLLVDISINCVEACLGILANLEHLDGSMIEFTIPAGIQHGQIVKLSKKGFKNPENDRYGDLLIRVSVKTLTDLSEEDKQLLEKLSHRKTLDI